MASLRRLLAALGGMQLPGFGRPTPVQTVSSLVSESSRGIASATNENAGMNKFYKSIGMKPPQPRRMSPDAQKVHDELFNKVSRAPRAASTSAVRRRANKQQRTQRYYSAVPSSYPYGTKPAILGAEVAPAGMLRMMNSESGTTAEEDQVDRILDAGAKRLFESEEGREKIREGSYNLDETAKTMLEAAKEALDEREGNECADDSSKAKDAAEKIKSGSMDIGSVAQRVKEKVTGLGQTS